MRSGWLLWLTRDGVPEQLLGLAPGPQPLQTELWLPPGRGGVCGTLLAWRAPGREPPGAGRKPVVCVFPIPLPQAFYQRPITGVLGEGRGSCSTASLSPAAQGSEVPGAQRACGHESGELSVTVGRRHHFYSGDPHSTSPTPGVCSAPAVVQLYFLLPSHEPLGRPCTTHRAVARGYGQPVLNGLSTPSRVFLPGTLC